jgi:GGDEF domain-containing protein
VISIKRYMRVDGKADDTLLRLVHLLMEGIERHSVEGAPEELARLREGTRRVVEAIESAVPPDELLELGAGAMDALKQYNEHVAEHLRGPIAELRAKVRLLTDAITAISGSSSENIQRLQEIKGRLLSPLDPRDIRSMRMKLSQCLDGVLAEAERQRAESDRAAEQLNRRGINPPNAGAEDSPIDPETGLPTRDQAEEVIAQACQDGDPAFVAVMALNQMQTINRSLGRQFGDMILLRFATFVRRQLPVVHQAFRWSGPTVVALVRSRSMLEARATMEPILSQRLSVRTADNDVQVPISTRWTLLPLTASPRLLFHKMDSFANPE